MSAADDEIGRFTEYSVHHQMIYSITKRPRPGDEGHGLEQPPHSWRAYRVGADLDFISKRLGPISDHRTGSET
jgi:hypothetical protein